ncbi:flavodoxin family protein [Pseudoflavonifractor sp. DSM 107456]|uniref:Flavodoxin family protein n=1 Tax=Pseudoflavonifractor gallinarum TaxID=2779352 RepID=A0ABR9RCT3_9FIRM|nr:flavodoxin family protein [Pseudoflavonifractor gallinarum]
MVHILGLCASPRREGATAYALRMVLEGAQGVSEEIETSMVTLAGKRIAPCTDCKACIRSHS